MAEKKVKKIPKGKKKVSKLGKALEAVKKDMGAQPEKKVEKPKPSIEPKEPEKKIEEKPEKKIEERPKIEEKKPVKPEKPVEKPKEKPRPKKKGKLIERAKETIAEAKEAKKAKKAKVEKPVTRLKGAERIYTIPLRKQMPRTKRTKAAVHDLRAFVEKHTKAENIVISKEVNEYLWRGSYKRPPASIRIALAEDEEGRIVVGLKG